MSEEIAMHESRCKVYYDEIANCINISVSYNGESRVYSLIAKGNKQEFINSIKEANIID